MRLLLPLLFLLAAATINASEQEIHLGRFSAGNQSGWKEQTLGIFKSKTVYTLARDNEKSVLMARSSKSASGRIYKLNLDPKEYQTLKWSWKIDHIIRKGDEKTRDGDDFAARVYVVFPRGLFSSTRAICYVWANKLPKGEHVVSPFTPNIITVAVDSGDELAGRWTFHQQNIHDDYRRFFGEEPPRIGGVALMTDTDNTGESAVGYYGDFTLVRTPKVTDGRQKEHKDQKSGETTQKEPKPKELNTKKGSQGNGEPVLPSSELQQPGKAPDILNNRVPERKEQPIDAPIPAPAAAPQSAMPK